MSKQTSSPNSSFEPLDLLSFLKSGRTTPFHIFIDFVIPQFLGQLSKRKQQLSISTQKDSDLEERLNKIENRLTAMKNACGTLKEWEDKFNEGFKDLILKSLDDAFKEKTKKLENSRGLEILEERLDGAWKVVSMLTNQLSSGNLESRSSFKPSRFAKKLELNIENMMSESSTFKEIREVYNGLGVDKWKQNCLLCFSVFPQNAVIKKKALVHWWVGEGLLSNTSREKNTAEEKGNDLFEEFMARGIIERVPKKRRPSSELCKMHPLIRYAVIRLAKENEFIGFDRNGNPTADFSEKKNKRGFLVTTEEESSELRELTYGFRLKQENIVRTLFNVNEPYVDLREHSLSQMTNMRVLQLGRFQDRVKQADAVEVFDTEFLKGLKKMKHLRYLSLRGISRVRELPVEICKLTELIIVDLHGCKYLEKLPEGIGSLKNLTRLDISGCYLISHMPVGLSKLSKLQVLHGFLIGKPGRDGQDFCNLVALANLKYLKKLSIYVKSKELAPQLIHLSKFENLVSLSVAWSEKEQRIEQENSKNTTTTPLGSSSLAKLELRYLPYSKMPDWVTRLNLKKLKKLYVRGGKLSQVLHPVGCEKWKVSILRLELLSELQMDWRQLRALFPELRYVQKVRCPKLILFPCDENGEWVNGECVSDREADTPEMTSEDKLDSFSCPLICDFDSLKFICKNYITFRI
jgi:Leucine-rich repeat (LRR) protein